MNSAIRNLAHTSVAQLLSHTRTPLYGNAYALILSSAATSGLGVVYWIMAARLYATGIVGLNSAAISAMMFLAGVAQLNLTSALMRFIPTLGRHTKRFLIYTYLIGTSAAAGASLLFISGLDTWAPALDFLRSGFSFVLWFSAATMGWCIFVLQDSALTGLRQAMWVPIENSLFAVAKLILLIAFAIPFPQYGVLASWTLALGLSLLPTNLLIFRRLIPKHVKETLNQESALVPQQVAKFVVADYFGSLWWLMATTLMPVIVIDATNAVATAYFYLSWTIVYSLYNVSANMGQSLLVEGARDQANLNIYSNRMFIQTAKIVIPIVILLVIGAPYILEIFGPDYAAEGTVLLRILALSAIPNIVTALYVSIARVQRRMTAVVAVLSSLCILVLVLSQGFIRITGIAGVGWAWLISQTVIAGILMSTQLRVFWKTHSDDLTAPPNLQNNQETRVGFGNSGIILERLAYRLAVQFKWLVLIGQPLWNYWHDRTRFARVSKLIAGIAPTIPPVANVLLPATWTERRFIRTVSDMIVVMAGPPAHPPVVALKLPQTENARRSLERQIKVLETLRDDLRLGDFRTLLPAVLGEGSVSGQPYVVERVLPGIDARRIIANPNARLRILTAAVTTIQQLHQHTAMSVMVNEDLLERWVDKPLDLIRDVKRSVSQVGDHQEAIDRLAVGLRRDLIGRRLYVSWVHGDFVPGNILVTPDGNNLTGIVDWDLAQRNDLPLLDLLQFMLSSRVIVERRELGEVLKPLLSGEQWNPQEQTLLDDALSTLPGDNISARALLLLSWLRHVSANVAKSTRYATHWLWVAKNVEAVLELV